MEGDSGEVKELRAENRAQNRRLQRVEERVAELRVALVGIDDRNGLRGELRDHKEYTQIKLAGIEDKIDKIMPAIFRAIAAGVGFVGTLVGIAAALYKILGGS
jgi:hypothetical protein